MQDCYAGDIGDFGKFALLRELQKQGLSIGVNWYKTDAVVSEKQHDGKYCISDQLAVCDPELAALLRKVFHSRGNTVRSIRALENCDIIPGASYFSEEVSIDHRDKWHQRALNQLSGSQLVFLDPDNGMIVRTAEKNRLKQCKYVFDTEVRDYLCHGHSVLIYQHRPRIRESVYMAEMIQRFMDLNQVIRRNDIQVITFPRYSIRDYFAISVSEEHLVKIKRAFSTMMNGIWGSGDKPICRLPKGTETSAEKPFQTVASTEPSSNVGE